jgi:hypothetical protein
MAMLNNQRVYIYIHHIISYTHFGLAASGKTYRKATLSRFFFVTTAPSAAVDLPTGMPQGDGRSIISSSLAIQKATFQSFCG